jgi:hypothetical protein
MYCTIWWWLTRTETCELYQADMIINFAGMTSCRLVDIYLCVGGSCCLDSYSEHGGNKFYRNVCDYLPLGMASHSKRPVWYFQTSRDKHWFLWDGDCSKSVYIREMSTVLGTLFFSVLRALCSQRYDFTTTRSYYFPRVLHCSSHFCVALWSEECTIYSRDEECMLLYLRSPFVLVTWSLARDAKYAQCLTLVRDDV